MPLDLAIGLFQEGQYTQARQVLVRLQRARPQDARVSYYSALTNGLTTGVWDGETKMLLDKAVKRERAGTPSRAQVDAQWRGSSRSKASHGSRATGSSGESLRPPQILDNVAFRPTKGSSFAERKTTLAWFSNEA
jgi:hypothetical protein